MRLDTLVSTYIQVRDRKAALKAQYEKKAAELDLLSEQIEGQLLLTFDKSGMQSVKTENGTAYVATRAYANIGDWDAFIAYVMKEEAGELLEHRCSKNAVAAYREEHNDSPPGVVWREERVVNIRRS